MTASLCVARNGSIRLWVCLYRFGFYLALCGFALTTAVQAQPQPRTQPSEAAVKAAFLYKFTSFAQWPSSVFLAPDSPFVIGVFDDDEVAEELEELVKGRVFG